MNPINQAWCIQIEANNICPGRCSYCTRFNSHLRNDQRFSITPERLREILASLERQGYTGKIGMIGGEPTIHPRFTQLCNIIHECWTSKGRWAALWTSGGAKYQAHKSIIDLAFSWIAYNDHRDPQCHHQRMTMASQDVVPDEQFRTELIDNCWVQRIWCPTITPRGAYFCECAGAWDYLMDGDRGWSLDEDWLSYSPEDYKKQMEVCQLCGMAVPMDADPMHCQEWISKSAYQAFVKANAKNIPAEIKEDFVDREIYEQRIPTWEPGEYTPGRAKGGAI